MLLIDLFTICTQTAFANNTMPVKIIFILKIHLVLSKLHHWQDIKFGLLMHWGTYSQWGIVESWSICPEDEGWTQRSGPYASKLF